MGVSGEGERSSSLRSPASRMGVTGRAGADAGAEAGSIVFRPGIGKASGSGAL